MAGSLNKVSLIGNVVRDPETRSTQDGSRICNITLATSERWKTKDGEQKEKSEFHRIVCFNDRITDVVDRYVRKGDKLYIEGSLNTRKWTDKDGQERYTTEIAITRFKGEMVMLEGPKGGGRESGPPQDARSASPPPRSNGRQSADLEDEVPFAPEWR